MVPSQQREAEALSAFFEQRYLAASRWMLPLPPLMVLLTVLGDLDLVGHTPAAVRLVQLAVPMLLAWLARRHLRHHRVLLSLSLGTYLALDMLGYLLILDAPQMMLASSTLLVAFAGVLPLPMRHAVVRFIGFGAVQCSLALAAGLGSEYIQFFGFAGLVGLVLSSAQYSSLRALWRSEQAGQEKTREAQAAIRAREVFIARVSHELRTPLGGVLGTLDLLDADGPLNPAQTSHLGIARSSGALLLTLVNDILDFSRASERGLSLAPAATDLRALIAEVLQAVRTTGSRDLDLVAEIDPALPQALLIDPARTRQMLFNLVGNAVKFTPAGEVRVRVTWGDRLIVEVCDTGIGVPDDAERLFMPFEQASDTVTRQFGGTGLGLAVCRLICCAAGGTISARRRPEGGSVFTVTLPPPPQASLVGAAAPRCDLFRARGARLLIADDNAVNQLILRRTCEEMGFTVTLASDGVEALTALREGGFVAALMDHHMPHMDGLEATTRARAEGVTIPIIGITASVLPADRRAGEDAGLDAHVRKPVDREQLSRTLHALLRAPAA